MIFSNQIEFCQGFFLYKNWIFHQNNEIWNRVQSSSKSIFTGFLSDFETKTNETSSTIDSQKEFHRNPTIGTLGSTLPKNPESGKSSSADVIDLWTWGDQPGKDQLEHCLNLLCQVSPKEKSKFSGKRVNLTNFFYFPELFRNNKNYATMRPEQRFTRTGSGKGQPSLNVTTSPNAGTVKRPPRPRIKSTPKTIPTSKKSRKKRPKFRELKA